MDPVTLLLLLGGGGFLATGLLKKRTADQAARRARQNAEAAGLAVQNSSLPVDNLVLNIDKAGPIAEKVGGTVGGLLASKGGAALAAGVGGGLTGAGLAAAGAAWVAGGAAAGKLITGDWGGAIAGGLSTTAGNVGNIGRVLGREIDKFLGGDGKGATGITLQVTGFVGGLAVGIFGLMALPLFGQVIAIVAAIGAAISDNARLQYGQLGAVNDAKDAAKTYFDQMLPKVEGFVRTGFQIPPNVPLTPEDQMRCKIFALAYTIGFINEENQAKYRVHMAKTKGVFVSDHRQWAVDRGVFVENMNPVIDSLYWLVSPLKLPGPPPTSVLTKIAAFQFNDPEVKAYTAAFAAVATAGKDVAQQLVGLSSSSFLAAQNRGRFLSNVMHYLQSMQETWGVGATAKSHAEYWRDTVKAFTGTIDADGNLIDGNYGVAWKPSLDAGAAQIVQLKP